MVNYKPGQMRRHKAPTRKHLHALNQIATGARLEFVNRKYWLAGRRIPTSIGHTLLKEGWEVFPVVPELQGELLGEWAPVRLFTAVNRARKSSALETSPPTALSAPPIRRAAS